MAAVMKFLCTLISAFFLSSCLVVAQTPVSPAPTGADPTAELMYTLHKTPDSGDTSTSKPKEAGMSAVIVESTRKPSAEGSTVGSFPSGNSLSFSKDISTPPMNVITTEHHTSHITTSITEESKKEPSTTPMSDRGESTENTIPKKETIPPVAGSTPKPEAKETTISSIDSHGATDTQDGPKQPVDKITTSKVSTAGTTTTKQPMTIAPNSGESSIPGMPDEKSLATSARTSILIVIISVIFIVI